MESIECTKCGRMIVIVEKSQEFEATGELNLVFICPGKRCGAKVRVPLLEYKGEREERH